MQQTQTIHAPQANHPPLVLNRREAAEALRISVRQLDSLLRRGEIAATRIDSRVVVSWRELLRFVEKKSRARQQLRERVAGCESSAE